MGRKTLESFPGGLPLKNRINIVLTRNENYKVKDAIIVHSIEELMEELKKSIRQKMYTASAAILSISSFFLIAMLLR